MPERLASLSEEVAQDVLVAACEEEADLARALEDRPHPLRERVGIAVGLARVGDLLELVDEQDHVLAVLLRDPLRQAERVLEVALGIAFGEARLECDLELVAELVLRLEHDRRARRVRDEPAGLARPVQDSMQARSVRDRGCYESLGELRRVGDPKQIEGRDVVAARLGAGERGLAHARLPGPSRPGDDKVRARHEGRRDLANVFAPTDEQARRQRQVGREEISALRAGHGRFYSISCSLLLRRK